MKCNNRKCKYFKDGSESKFLGMLFKDESGCKFSYCKKNRKKKFSS